jgi:Sec-independent protein translocase protein TatA
MEILGIGMPELIFIFIVAIIVMGPKDMQKAGKTVGKWLRSIVTSDGWKIFQQTSRELRTLPNRLMREANEELEKVNKIGKDINPMDTLDAKYPGPAKNQPMAVSLSGREYPAPTASQPVPIIIPDAAPKPIAEFKEDESDPKKDA